MAALWLEENSNLFVGRVEMERASVPRSSECIVAITQLSATLAEESATAEELRLEELRPGIWQRYPPNRITKTITRPIIFEATVRQRPQCR